MSNRKKLLVIALPLVLSGCATPYTLAPPQHHANIVWNIRAGDHSYKPHKLLVSEHKEVNGGTLITAPKNTCYVTWYYNENLHYKEINPAKDISQTYRVNKHGQIYYTYSINFTVPTRVVDTSSRTEFGPPIYMRTSPYRSFDLLFSAATGKAVNIFSYSQSGFLPSVRYSLKDTNCVFSANRRTSGITSSETAAYYEGRNSKTGKIYFRIYKSENNPRNSYIYAYPDTKIVRLFGTVGERHTNNYPERVITSYLHVKRIEPDGTLIGRITTKTKKMD